MGFYKPTLNSKHDHLSLIVLGAGAFALGLTICRLWMNGPDFKQHKAPSNSENPPHEDGHENDHEDDYERLRLYSAPLTPIRGRQYSLLDEFPLPPSSSTIDELAKPASLNGHSTPLLQQQEKQQENQQPPSSTSQSTISSPTSPFTPPSQSPISLAEQEQEQEQKQKQTQQQTQQEKFNWTNFSQNENLLPTPPPPAPSSSSSSPNFSPSSSPSSPSPKRKQTPSSSSPNFFSGTSAWPHELPRRMMVVPSPPLPPLTTTTITTTNEQPFVFRGVVSSLSSLPASASASVSQEGEGEGGCKKD